MIITLFWLSIFIIVHVYFIYPASLFVLSKIISKVFIRKQADPPTVSLIISAYNEANVIRKKIENSLDINYPREKLEIIVVSDCSTDDTDEIVKSFKEVGIIRLVRQAERKGKTEGVNMAVPLTKGDIILFSDANIMYDKEVLTAIVKNFDDPAVGYVVGESCYIDTASGSAVSEGLYWRYEQFLKKAESHIGSVVGGDGAIYAIRRELYTPLASDDINDFLNPNQIILKGYKGVYDPEAIGYETTAGNLKKEFNRKVRIISRSFKSTFKVLPLFNPFMFGIFSYCIWSHKLLRWFVPFFMTISFILNLLLMGQSRFYLAILLLQLLFYFAALVAWLYPEGSIVRITRSNILLYFCVVNIASFAGVIKAVTGKTSGIWNTSRN